MRRKLALYIAGAFALFTASAEASVCRASFYGGGERLNRHTANGEVFRPQGLTAAHRHWRFGTKVLVTHGKRSVVVRINDRGPAAWTGKCIDLSLGAARALGMVHKGVGTVRLQIIK